MNYLLTSFANGLKFKAGGGRKNTATDTDKNANGDARPNGLSDVGDKSFQGDQSAPGDSLDDNPLAVDPQISVKCKYGSLDNETGQLSITIEKMSQIKLSYKCQLYIRMLLLPEAKKELKRKTKAGIHMIIRLFSIYIYIYIYIYMSTG